MATAVTSKSAQPIRRVRQAAKPNPTEVPTATDELADALASKLTIAGATSNVKRRTRAPTKSSPHVVEEEIPVEQQRISAMRGVNAASQVLSGIVQSGWKKGAEGKDTTILSNAIAAATSSAKHLEALRMISSGDVDVERAAMSVLGKLVSLELFEAAYNALADLYPQICTILDVTPSEDRKSFLRLLSIPIPSVATTNSVVLNLTSTYLAYSFTILTHPSSLPPSNAITHDKLATFVRSSANSTILQWIHLFSSLPEKHVDAVLMRAYTAVTRFCSSTSNTLPSPRTTTVGTKAAPTSKSSKQPAETAPSLESLFNLRCYALSCLIHTSPTATVTPTAVWDQAVRSAAAFIKALPAGNDDAETQATQLILQRYTDFLERAQKRTDAARFVSVDAQEGKGFLSFCEYWMAFARRSGDICALERIGSLMRSNSPSSSAKSSPANVRDADEDGDVKMSTPIGETTKIAFSLKSRDSNLTLMGTRIYGSLTQITVVLDAIVGKGKEKENLGGTANEGLAQKLSDSITTLNSHSSLAAFLVPVSKDIPEGMDSIEAEGIRRISAKIDRAFEKVRRTGHKVYESLSGSSNSHTEQKIILTTRTLLELCVSSLERALPSAQTPTAISDIITRLLDTIFALSRVTLQINDPRTYIPSYEYLVQGKLVLQSIYLRDVYATSSNIDVGNFVRCLSGAFHNMSGSLYQAGRYGHAVPFLRESCTLGGIALELRERQREADMDQSEERNHSNTEGWKQLTEQLYRRWELLGVCYAKNGDRKSAFSSFKRCIYTFPYVTYDVASQSDILPAEELFNGSSSIKQLVSIVDRITYMGACELLLPPEEVSLRPSQFFPDPGAASTSYLSDDPPPPKPFLDPRIMGLILERQLKALEPSKWKEGVSAMYSKILKDLGATYRDALGERMPIRRARVILKWIEFVFTTTAGQENEGMEGSIADVEEVALEVKRLLASEDLAIDINLKTYIPQYSAMVDLWLALHIHKRENPDQISSITAHVDQAYKTLKELLSREGTSPRKNKDTKVDLAVAAVARVVTSPKIKTTRTQRVPAAPRKAAPKTRGLVTPKPRLKGAQPLRQTAVSPPRPAVDAESSSAKSQLVFDNFSELLSLLQSVASMLGLLSLMLPRARILSITRKLCERLAGTTSNDYVTASIDLAHEYVHLGKTRAAGIVFNQVLASIQSGQCSEEVCTTFFLRFAEAMVAMEDVSESSSAYCKALSLSNELDIDEKGMPTAQRVYTRVRRLEKAAMASHIFSLIQYCRDDVPIAFEAMLQSLRLWNRAMDTLQRLNPSFKPEVQPESDPFSTVDASSKNDASSSRSTKVAFRRPKEAMEWRISAGLLSTLFSLSQMYLNRGAPREAEYFAQEAQTLAEGLNAPAALGRALAKKGEINLQLGRLEEGHAYLLRASEVLHDIPGVEIADIYRLQAEYQERMEHFQDAEMIYTRSTKMLEELNSALSQVDGPRKSLGLIQPASEHKDILVPQLLAAILRHYVWLLRQERDEAFESALNQLLSLPGSSPIKIEENSLVAKLNLQDAYGLCRGDMFLSSLAESTIALPMGVKSDRTPAISTAARNILDLLQAVRQLYRENLNLSANKGNVWDMRESAIVLSLVNALEVSLGKGESDGEALAVTTLLDAASGITLRREKAEIIMQKFPVFADDLKWPILGTDGSSIRQLPSNSLKPALISKASSSDSSDDEADDDPPVSEQSSLEGYWSSVLQRYQDRSFDPNSSTVYRFPASWTVIHINVTEDRNTLFLSRLEGGDGSKSPLIFRVPLQGRRDNGDEDEEERLTFQDATEELKDIISLSNEGTKAAAQVKSGDETARISWWKQRAALDLRLKELLENIEFCWLGAFKTILCPRPHLSTEAIASWRAQFERVFQHCVHLEDKKSKPKAASRKKSSAQVTVPTTQVSLNDDLIERFSTLSPKCRDEELEDLIYFVLDLYQFHGIPVVIAEVDIAQAVVDLRSVLEENAQRNHPDTDAPSDQNDEKEHVFLVLDKNLQDIPWESIPILRGRSVSRIPNLDFLQDRVQYSRWRSESTPQSTNQSTGDRLVLNPHKGYFILNPSGDLSKTEERFRGWTQGMQEAGWDGTVGKSVSEQQFISALKTNDLVIYFGHGGGEQYVRSHNIRNLPSCAATMLWGCSSGALKDMGDFDRIGTPFNYMLAGCPTLVANLWDVTDRDIDKFSQTVFDKMGLTPETIHQPRNASAAGKVSVVSAVAESREACRLKYLTGAAPVVYGIPFYL